MSLRLSKLPDTTPVKFTVTVNPDLAAMLSDYAQVYRETYGADEKPEALIPAMLETFLGGDAGFKRARRALHANASNER